MNLFSYIYWHFAEAPFGIIKLTSNFLVCTEHLFSISILLKTIFAPFRRVTFDQGPGFSFSKYFEVVLSNLISRILGAIIRTVVIAIGIICQLVVILFGFTTLIIFIPLIGFTLPIYYHVSVLTEKKKERKEILSLFSRVPFPDLTASELGHLAKTDVGSFLFSRLVIEKNDIGKLSLKELLNKYPLSEKDFYEVVRWYNHAKDDEEEYSKWWNLNNLLRVKPIGRDWVYGYTINLDRYTTDLVLQGYELPHLVGRRAEIDRIVRILSQSGNNNVLLVGDAGSGRHAIVLAFALDVFEGKVLTPLRNKRVLELNLNILISEAKTPTEVKGTVAKILDEAISAGNIILVIDDFDRFVGGGQNSVDLTDVFSKAFTRKDLQAIGITNREAYHKSITGNSQINKIFEMVEVAEISQFDTLKILEHLTPYLETKYKVFIPFPSLKTSLEKTESITTIPYPEKAIDILTESALQANTLNNKVVSQQIVETLISQKTKIPTGQLLKDEKEKLINLENLLHEHIINQEEAITEIARSLRRARLELASKGKPIGTFLFLGPTGVGKTETAKALARVYFGSEKLLNRIDMSQFQDSQSVKDLIGNTQNSEPGILVKAVRDNPFSVLLLDEIEKASKDILNILLPILDEGYIMDSFGRKVSFTNTIIIGTSNAGSEFIRQRIQENADNLSKELTEYVLREKIFSPEFINRFDSVVVYKPLTKEHLKLIARLMLTKLNKRMEPKKITVEITDDLIEKISSQGYDPQFGARPMNRVILEKVEDHIAQGMLNGTIKAGDKVIIPI
ncbi:ATP-dependent Clp protease ATP-binding subunit [Candidatus Gottesmanbacteria bacterium]|nr:ATP-dependent Clp protease ATP-binding subunit [Candidatus Gottesmanbacteria bacterium]